jgi:hypothetical protein
MLANPFARIQVGISAGEKKDTGQVLMGRAGPRQRPEQAMGMVDVDPRILGLPRDSWSVPLDCP